MKYVKYNNQNYNVYYEKSKTEWLLCPETDGKLIILNPEKDNIKLLN